jgi:hypothetical protein
LTNEIGEALHAQRIVFRRGIRASRSPRVTSVHLAELWRFLRLAVYRKHRRLRPSGIRTCNFAREQGINDRCGRCAIGFGLFPPDIRAFKGHAAFHRVPERWEF